MRQIKFKAWDPLNQQMLNHEQIIFGSFEVEDIFGLDEDDWKFPKKMNLLSLLLSSCEHHYKLMQFTGLLDKNGREIYEGDVVQEGINKCEVLWGVSGWDPFEYCGGGELNSNQCKIIGNIYENPNLLEK